MSFILSPLHFSDHSYALVLLRQYGDEMNIPDHTWHLLTKLFSQIVGHLYDTMKSSPKSKPLPNPSSAWGPKNDKPAPSKLISVWDAVEMDIRLAKFLR